MMTVADIFTTLQGPAKVGLAIGKPTEHAAAMKRRGSIPVRYWPSLIDYAAENNVAGVTYDALVRAHAAKPAAQMGALAS